MKKISKLILAVAISIGGILSLSGCEKSEEDSFSIKTSETKYKLDATPIVVDFTLSEDSLLKSHDFSEIKWKVNDKVEKFKSSTSSNDYLSTKWSFEFTSVGKYKVSASIGSLSSKNSLTISIVKDNAESIVSKLSKVLDTEGGLVLGEEYDIGLSLDDAKDYSLQDVDDILKINENGKLEIIGIGTGKLKFLHNGIIVLDTYYAVSHSLLCTNIKNELKKKGIIESQSAKVSNAMLKEVTYLDLSDELQNDIESTKGLKYLTELEEIDLSNNYVSDVSWLASCTKLKKVNLSYNSIENFDSIVDNQELEYLDVSHNNVNNISKIKFMQNIKYLDLSDNNIKDISDVSTSYGLESLFLNNNDLSVFKDRLSGLENLKELGVGNCNIPFTEIASLEYLNKLNYLDITNTNPNIDEICNLSNLKTLILNECKLNTKSLDRLNELSSLQYLDISNNQLDAETYNKALDGNKLKNLNYLKLGGNEFINIPELSSFTKLDTLDLSNSYNLLNLDGVEALSISSLIIDDCNSLSNDTFKERIDAITTLKKLSVSGAFNFINKESFDYICNLVNKDIEVKFIDDKYVNKTTIKNYKSNVFFSFDELKSHFETNDGNIVLTQENGCREIILSLISETQSMAINNRKVIIDKTLFKLSIFGNPKNTYRINFELNDRKTSSFTFNLYQFIDLSFSEKEPVIKAEYGSKVIINSCYGDNYLIGATGKVTRKGDKDGLQDIAVVQEASSAFVGYDLFINGRNGSKTYIKGGNGGDGANSFEDNKGNSSPAWYGLNGANGADAIICHNIQLTGKNISIKGGNGGKGGKTFNGPFTYGASGNGGNGGTGIVYSGNYDNNLINGNVLGGDKGIRGECDKNTNHEIYGQDGTDGSPTRRNK